MKSLGERVATCLVNDGLLTQPQVDDLLGSQNVRGSQLLKALTDRQLVTDEDVVIGLSQCLGVPPLSMHRLHVPPELAELLPRDLALAYRMVPVARVGNKLFVTMADPLNVLALDDVRRRLPRLEIIPLISTEKSVVEFLNGTQNDSAAIDALLKDADLSEVEVGKEMRDEIDLSSLVEGSQQEPVIKLVNMVLAQAVKDGASDVHFEPFERQLRVRYRIDGLLYDLPPVPHSLHAAIASRIKVMAKLDIAERRQPQDGRFCIKLSGRDVDLRVSVVPTVHGEKIVLRLLDKSRLNASLTGLALPPTDFERFNRAIEAPHGMILITGPTGSGKTSTLYAALTQLNTNDVNIMTIEDPVEYRLLGVNQIQVKPEVGVSFATGLRSILRQDPDIVMVGEIRDLETADIAVKAALTGHLVLSTLHTNDAPGAITRLLDMGIEPFLVSSSLVMVCAQRLVRRICPHCKVPQTVPADLAERLQLDPASASTTFYHGRGCARCKQTGFRGRCGILEVLPMSAGLRNLVLKKASAAELQELAVREGMRTLRQAGLEKAKAGLTSLDEVLRVTGGN